MKFTKLPNVLPSLLLIIILTTTFFNEETEATRSSLLVHPPSYTSSYSSSCGSVHNITFPFRLKTDPLGVGDPDYQLTCLNNKTLILEFSSGKYYVKKISYDKQIIRVVDFNFINGSSCALPYSSLSSDQVSADFRYRGIASQTYTTFIRCSEEVIGDPSYREVPCASRRNGSSPSFVYVNYGDFYSVGLPHKSCRFVSTVPGDYINVKNPSYDEIENVLESGFDLAWSVECRDCLVAGDSCVFTTFTIPLMYVCDDQQDDIVGTIVSIVFSVFWILLFAVTLIARYILAPIVIIGFLIHKYRKEKRTTEDNMEKFPPNQQQVPCKMTEIVDDDL